MDRQQAYEELVRRGAIRTPEQKAAEAELLQRGLIRALPAPAGAPRAAAAAPSMAAAPPAAAAGQIPPPQPKGFLQTLKEGALGALGTGLDVLGKPSDAFNAGLHEFSQAARQGANPLEAVNRGIRAGDAELQDIHHHQPPLYFRDLFGMERGKTNRTAYNTAATADYVTDFLFNPGAKLTGAATGAASEALSPVRRALGRTGLALAATRPAQIATAPARALNAFATAKLASHAENLWTRGVGIQKQLWLSQPQTQVANAMSNLAVSELAAQRNGVNPGRLLSATAQAAKELRAGASADLTEIAAHIPDFAQTLASTATGATSTRNPFLKLQGFTEQAAKLALFKVLKTKMPPAQAAKQVQKYLFDYADRPALLELADKLGAWTFNAYPTKAAGLFLDTLNHRPDLVARYPRLQKQLMAEFPGSWEVYQKLPPNRRSALVVPTGKDTFLDVGRYNFLTQSLQTVEQLREGFQAPAPADVLASTVAGPTLSTLARQPKGAPVEDQWWAFLKNELRQRVPILNTTGIPGVAPGRIGAAKKGLTMSDYKFGEPQTRREALLQSLAGLVPMTGETPDEKKQRLAPQVSARGNAAAAYVNRVDAELAAGKIANPYLGPMAQVTDPAALGKKAAAIRGWMHMQLTNPAQISAGGKITGPGQAKLARALLTLRAIEQRVNELQAGQAAGAR